jgi:hypothetical protein
MTKTTVVGYPDDCKERQEKNHIMCKLFGMSCAMFHTCIANRKDGKCCYYEVKKI